MQWLLVMNLHFYWAMNWDANGGGKGFDFKSGGTTLFTVLNNGSSAAITTSSGGTADGNYGTNSNVGYFDKNKLI